jgi:quercetin dioxygenase-like cupin family protein
MKTLMSSTVLIGVLAFLGVAANARADGPAPTIVLPSDVKWGDAPPNMPPGAKVAVMAGDPTKEGLFTIRIKFPGGYKVPAHSHAVEEQITVLSGAFLVGVGDKLDPKQTKALPAGAFVAIPGKVNHYAMTKKDTVVELTAMGPFEMTYVNPADDPSKSAMK